MLGYALPMYSGVTYVNHLRPAQSERIHGMPLRRHLAVLTAGVAVTVLAAPAAATAAPDQELPFTCAETWTGSTRPHHQPSPVSVDFNRSEDLGMLVVASAGGTVSRVEDTGDSGYGRWVKIEHAEGYATVYAHLKTAWVVPGQFVDQGTPIGRVGDTGGVSGAHLHYEQRLGRDVRPAIFHGEAFAYDVATASQNCPDVPLAGDWDGDRADEVAVFHRDAGVGTFERYAAQAPLPAVRLGRASDLPVAGDWDGDGVTDLGVRRQAARLFLLRTADGTVRRTRLGAVKDVPVTGDWDGNAITDVGLWRPRSASFRLLLADGTQQVVRLGTRGSQPVTGDWDGDGVTDLGVFETGTATFWLRTTTAGGQVQITYVPLGTATDLPVTGDWDGDGTAEVGTWAPETATYTLQVGPLPTSARWSGGGEPELRTISFGRPR